MNTKKMYLKALQTAKRNLLLLVGLLVLVAGFLTINILRNEYVPALPSIFLEIMVCAVGVALGALVAYWKKLADACLVIFGIVLLIRGIGIQPDSVFQGVYSTAFGTLLLRPVYLVLRAAIILFFVFAAWHCAAVSKEGKKSVAIYMLTGAILALIEIAATFASIPVPYIALSCGTYFHFMGIFLSGMILKITSQG